MAKKPKFYCKTTLKDHEMVTCSETCHENIKTFIYSNKEIKEDDIKNIVFEERFGIVWERGEIDVQRNAIF